MKVKPYTYQQGGSLFLPVNVQLERANPHYGGMLAKGDEADETSGNGSRSGSKSKSGNDDDLLGLLKSFEKDLLPNEAEAFYSELVKLQKRLETTGQPLTASMLLQLKSQLPRMVHNHAEANKARDNMLGKGTQDEYAISAEGALYNMKKDGSIEMIPLAQYNPEKHTNVLTNGELLHMREYSPQLINDVNTITAVNNGQSAQQIVDFIDKILAKAHSSENKEEFTTNMKTLNAAASTGVTDAQLDALRGLASAGLTGEQLVNYSYGTNNPAVTQALNYIMKIMPKPMKYYLYTKTMVDNGLTYKQVTDGSSIGELLLSAADTYSKEDVSITADSTKTGAAGGGGKGSQVVQTPTTGFFHRTQQKSFAITDSTYSTSLDLTAPASVGILRDTKDQSTLNSPMTIEVALDGGTAGKGTGWGNYCDKDKVWVGGMELPYGMLNTIVYDNTEVAQVALPVTKDGKLDTGLLKKISQAFNDYKTNHNKSTLTAEDKREALKESFLTDKVSINPETGIMQYSGGMAEFLVVYGYLNDDDDKAIQYDEHLSDIRYYKKLDGYDEEVARAKINSAEGYSGSDSNWYDNIYKAPIFIKLAPNYSSLVELEAKTVKEDPLDEHTLNVHDVKHQQDLSGSAHSSSRINE